ncbi:MAG: hypothetical protein ACMG6S_02590 [Byssovorax sp.]
MRATLKQLETLARDMEMEVRYEKRAVVATAAPKSAKKGNKAPAGTSKPKPIASGLCRLHDRVIIVCDAAFSTVDKVGVLAEALVAYDVELMEFPAILRARVRLAAGKGEEKGGPKKASQRPAAEVSGTPDTALAVEDAPVESAPRRRVAR